MIDFSTWCQIRDHLGRQQLTVTQTAQALGLDPRTVAYWSEAQFRPRAHTTPCASKLDPFKGQIVRWLDSHPYSAQQILQRLREIGFDGGRSIVKNYVARIRPRQHPAFLKLDFAPGECAQVVALGSFGSIAVGNTRRRLSLFVMVLCYSRRMYLEFTVSQTMEFFLACHEHAFAAFGGVPERLMVDNLRSAVLQRLAGVAPVFNVKYLDFARHRISARSSPWSNCMASIRWRAPSTTAWNCRPSAPSTSPTSWLPDGALGRSPQRCNSRADPICSS